MRILYVEPDPVATLMVSGALSGNPLFEFTLDAVPGRITKLYITPDHLGDGNIDSTLRVQCAELCGIDHAKMTVPVRIVSEEDFQAWLASIRKDG